nr:scopoletin glucosyltransferase-like [Ipomoea batatas]
MDQVHIFFFPMMAHGHMIPTLDMAKLFVYRGARATVITTPLNVPYLTKAIQKINHLGIEIAVRAITFPAAEAGLPDGCERMDQLSSDDLVPKFFKATALLQEPLEKLLQECRPNALVADMFFPWATDAAAKFGIPRLVFHGIGYFALCATENVRAYKPHRNVSSDFEPFLVPDLPHEIYLTRSQLSLHDREDSETYMTKLLREIKESESRSYGVIVNSVYELEPEYAEYYTKVLGKRAWHIGPLLLCNTKIEEKALREKRTTLSPPSSEERHEILKWLDTKKPTSVIYVCFGSMSHFIPSQLHEIAVGLEASGQQFIWVVLMVGEEAEGFRSRARSLKEKALNAIEPGGSSYSALNALLKEMSTTK